MRKYLRVLSVIFLLLALLGITALLATDFVHAFRLIAFHQQCSAVTLILIGSSYIVLQLGSHLGWSDKLKRVFLGFAFVLWGGEQFLPSSGLVTVMDSTVIVIFVIDLGLIILSQLRSGEQEE